MAIGGWKYKRARLPKLSDEFLQKQSNEKASIIAWLNLANENCKSLQGYV